MWWSYLIENFTFPVQIDEGKNASLDYVSQVIFVLNLVLLKPKQNSSGSFVQLLYDMQGIH